MEFVERIKTLQTKGLSIKGISSISDIPIESLYNITSGRTKHISLERAERLSEALEKAESIFVNDR